MRGAAHRTGESVIPIGLSGWTHAQIEQVFAVLKPRMTWPTGER